MRLEASRRASRCRGRGPDSQHNQGVGTFVPLEGIVPERTSGLKSESLSVRCSNRGAYSGDLTATSFGFLRKNAIKKLTPVTSHQGLSPMTR